ALLGTSRAKIAAIHVAHFWNPVLLARSLATQQALGGGRLVGLFGVGAGHRTGALGLPEPDPSERIARLESLLATGRALLAGETDSHGAAITPPPRPVPLAVAAASPRALELVRRFADFWDANVPPLRERLAPLRDRLGRSVPTWLWVFARPGASRD